MQKYKIFIKKFNKLFKMWEKIQLLKIKINLIKKD